MKDLKRRLALGLGLAVVVFIGLLLYGDVREISRLLQDFDWRLTPAILGLTVINYALRGVRFHTYLRRLGVDNISLWTSVRVFIGGFALTLTPGKVGELVRVFWLKNITGVDPVRMTPPIIVDRIVDGLAMALLALMGILAYPRYWPLVAAIMAILAAGIVLLQIRPLVLWGLALGERLPVVSKIAHHLHALYESAYLLLRPKIFLWGLLVGLLAWIAQGLAFYLILTGLGLPQSFNLTLLAVFTLAIGSLLGGASSLPGGLGAAEVSMTGILQTIVGTSENVAATATLMVRFLTLWVGIILGVIIVAIWRNTLFGRASSEAEHNRLSQGGDWLDSYKQSG